MEEVLPSELYAQLEPDRKPYEDRAEDICSITLPYVFTDDSFNSNTDTPYTIAQSFNGALVSSLKAKVGMALLPPSTSSFRFKPDPKALLDLLGGSPEAMSNLNKELSLKTDAVNSEIERQQIRSDLFDMILHMLLVGSVVVEKIEGDGIQIYPLKNFVVELDNKGRPYTIILKETLKYLPVGLEVKDEKEEYDLYTMAKYDKDTDKWVVTQDVDGEVVGKEKSYTYDKLPFRYFGWTWNVGDKYHRPFAEDYYSDMVQLNALSRVNTQGAVIASKTLIMVDQRGNRTKKADVANSGNGDVIDGRADDVTAFQLNKHFDFQVSNEREMEIKRQLQKSFLDTGSVTRDAERVTAQEIRIMAQQLETSTLAGIYSSMSTQWSKWIVEQVMGELGIKFEAIDVSVLTGLDALGRSQETQKLDGFVQRMAQLNMLQYIKNDELISRYASYDGINTVNLIKSPEEIQKEQQAQQQQMLQQQAGESIAGKAGDAIMQGGKQ